MEKFDNVKAQQKTKKKKQTTKIMCLFLVLLNAKSSIARTRSGCLWYPTHGLDEILK